MNRTGLGLAIGAGYLLGRTRKLKLAVAVGTMVAGRKLNLTPSGVAELVSARLRDNPQWKEIGDQLRGDLRGVGTAATGALVERRMDALADRLHGRTERMRDRLSGAVPAPEAETEPPDDTDDTAGTADTGDGGAAEDSGDGRDGARRTGTGTRTRTRGAPGGQARSGEPGAAKSAAKAPAKRAAAKASAKRTPAKRTADPEDRTAAKKTRSAGKSAAPRAGETRRTAGAGRTKGGGDR
ncbi:DNA primase [Streptomyces sp. SID8352]|uniref:DNA primase n=1 Tax=Streptomyces sp. SID8352 TaxID=2690338 RepID=UPI00136D2CC8|nr:DNA primase [Streptomyces sp. SID8352]MYU25196.1 DNA primase [Streptomyces sp. SID8352]